MLKTDNASWPSEVWRPVVGWESHYSVSNFGRVKRMTFSSGTRPGRIISGELDALGRRRVSLSANGRAQRMMLHQMVTAAFYGPCPDGCEVNHKDFNPDNNAADNLEYISHLANVRYSIAHGRWKNPPRTLGEDSQQAKLTDGAVRAIRRDAAAGEPVASIARRVGMSYSAIAAVVNRESWKHIV